MHSSRQHLLQRIAGRSAPTMFVLSLIFLTCQAVLVVVLVDIPSFAENVKGLAENAEGLAENAKGITEEGGTVAGRVRTALGSELVDHRIQDMAVYLILMIWPIVIAEAVFHWVTRPWNEDMRRYHLLDLLFCICPSIRMCARSPEMGGRLWLPGLGWRQANKRLRRRLERHFSVPMIVIAFMILPMLLLGHLMRGHVVQYSFLRLLLHVSTGTIWFAFAFEFILMFSVADKKISYCKSHWLDIAIIALPLVSFLRSLRVLRATQVTKMARIYRLRGTAVRALRALILLEFFQRVTRTDVDRRIEKLERQLVDVESEAKEIRRRIARLQRQRDDQAASQREAIAE